MIKVTPLCQRDIRWKDIKLGNSRRLTLGSDGCAVTSATMVGNYLTGKQLTPADLNTALKAQGGYAKNSAGEKVLIIWSVWAKIYGIKFIYRHTSYKNWLVASYVYLKNTPVIVSEYAPKIGARLHFCVFIGGGKMIDPWTGSIVSTSIYSATGFVEATRGK